MMTDTCKIYDLKRDGEKGPAAYLFSNGNGIYFDDKGEQIESMQSRGLCGLHDFVAKYPDAPVYWASWPDKYREQIHPMVIPCLLRMLRQEPTEEQPTRFGIRLERVDRASLLDAP